MLYRNTSLSPDLRRDPINIFLIIQVLKAGHPFSDPPSAGKESPEKKNRILYATQEMAGISLGIYKYYYSIMGLFPKTREGNKKLDLFLMRIYDML